MNRVIVTHNEQSYTVPLFTHEIGLLFLLKLTTISKPYEDDYEPPLTPEQEETVQGSTQEYTFVDLQPSTEYEIQVKAFTEAGEGEFTTDVFYTSPANSEQCKFQ